MKSPLVLTQLADFRIVPVVVIDDASHADPLADALVEAGLPCAEITFRTSAGEAALRTMSERGDIVVGAGTVLTDTQVDRAVDAGATFIVSPGLSLSVVSRAREHGVVPLPGVATGSEIQAAVGAGLSAVKFFPAEQLGGLSMLNALSAPFPDLRFLPSGGITMANASTYLDHPAVFAVGGSWMVPRDLIAAGDFDAVRRMAAEAVARLAAANPGGVR